MLPLRVLYYGRDEPLPAQIDLRAGPLALTYEQGDLRYIRLGDTEILRRIYVAVRDRDWGTIPARLSNIRIESGEDSFRIRYHADHRQREIDFGWDCEISGDAQGKMIFSMEGVARSTFWRNRIGFCILYPADLAGRPAEVEHTSGAVERTAFPDDLTPDQPAPPFTDLRCIAHAILPGRWAETAFQGEVFEMEDQRNFGDASFKVFCTPLRLPHPVAIRQGTRISQSVSIQLRDNEPVTASRGEPGIAIQSSDIEFDIDRSGKGLPIPEIGLGLASHGQPLTPREIERLRDLRLVHLRVDLALEDPGFIHLLRHAARQAKSLGIKLEAALILSGDNDRELAELRAELESLNPEVNAWLCYPHQEFPRGNIPPTSAVIRACRKYLQEFDPSIPFYAGTNTDLVILKRNTPPLDKIKGICLAFCPQIHAFDHASLVETLQVQGTVVESARRLGRGLPVRVSPVTLKMRFNPYATGPVPELQPGELPPQVDVRQMSLFGAGWTAGSFKYLAEAGAQSITFYETTGWRGVMETEKGSPLPELFPSLPGMVFPVYHLLASIADFKGGRILPLRSSSPLQANGFTLQKDQTERLVAANFSAERRDIRVGGAAGPASGHFLSGHFLDEHNVLSAMLLPEAFQSAPGEELEVSAKGGCLRFELQPFAIAVLDFHSLPGLICA
jgi:hypothetical protein